MSERISMNIQKIDEPLIIDSNSFQDERGIFAKLWQGESSWVKQINISQTKLMGTIRGIHGSFSQSEIKMVTCIIESFSSSLLIHWGELNVPSTCSQSATTVHLPSL